MKNVYEFKIEDIKEVKVKEKTGNHYTTIWKRNPKIKYNEFLEKYDADRDTYGDIIKVICPHCGMWNDISQPHNTCFKCNDKRDNRINENDLIACLEEFMKEFDNYEIYINGKPII